MSIEHSIFTDRSEPATSRLAAPVRRALAGLLTGLLLASAVMLFGRRLAGALEHPLPSGVLAVVAVVATLAAVFAQSLSRTKNRFFDELAWWAPAVSLVPIAAALTLPGTSIAGVSLLWLVPIAGEAATGYRRFVGRRRWRVPRSTAPGVDVPAPARASALANEDLRQDEQLFGPNVIQHFTRRQTDEGDDLIEGWLRTAFATGQRTAHAHIAFCPPFARMPELEFEQTDGPSARVKLGQLLHYGARFEMKLDTVGPAEVLVAFTARGRLTGADPSEIDRGMRPQE